MDEQAFHSFYLGTARPLRAYIARVLGDLNNVDDVAQESYLRLLRMPAAPDDPKQLRPLLFRIATNIINDEWRRKRRAANAADQSVPERSRPDPDTTLDFDITGVSATEATTAPDGLRGWRTSKAQITERSPLRSASAKGACVRVLLHRARRRLALLLQTEPRNTDDDDLFELEDDVRVWMREFAALPINGNPLPDARQLWWKAELLKRVGCAATSRRAHRRAGRTVPHHHRCDGSRRAPRVAVAIRAQSQ